MGAWKKKVLTILCVGSVILAWRVYVIIAKYLPVPAQAQSGARVVESAQPQLGSLSQDESRERIWEAQRFIAEQPWGRNPCADVPWTVREPDSAAAPVETTTAIPPPTPVIRLTGVSRSGDQWLAAVGGNIVRVGDMVANAYRVIEITRHSITLESAGWTFTYTIGLQEAVIRPLSEVQ